MFTLYGHVDGSRAIVRIEEIEKNIKPVLRQTVRTLSAKLKEKIKSQKLSGQVLKVRTGELRRSVSYRTTETKDGVSGKVFTNVPYAGVHEYGFSGTVAVPAHQRSITTVFGRKVSAVTATVMAHNKQVRMPERSFMRTSLAEMESEIYSEIEKAVRGALS